MPGRQAALRLLKRIAICAAAIAVGFHAVAAAILLFLQHGMIYPGSRYERGWERMLAPQTATVPYATAQGAQTAFLVARGKEPARHLWIMFSGNASDALAWEDFALEYPGDSAASLLVDYPGYGACEGKASPAAILENTEAALAAVRSRIAPDAAIGVAGHSLGAASALQFAAKHPVHKVVLFAPFTSMADMARMVVGPILSLALTHRFDNRARLSEVAAQARPPRVLILHGSADQVIPARMARELAALAPRIAEFILIEKADHDSVVGSGRRRAMEFMEQDGS